LGSAAGDGPAYGVESDTQENCGGGAGGFIETEDGMGG
jgi:hypothetical protein